jgi:hypothetical protein
MVYLLSMFVLILASRIDSVNFEIVEFDHVRANHFLQNVLGQMAEFPGDHLAFECGQVDGAWG